MKARFTDYFVTRYYRAKEFIMGILWECKLTDTAPASEMDFTALINHAELGNKMLCHKN